MYVPKHFEPNKPADRLVEEVCFGTLVEYIDGKLYAAHIPLHFDRDRKWAYGHLAKANELAVKWILGNSKIDALFIINGPSAYISSSWYASEEVPTYNYTAIQVKGTRTLRDRTETDDDLKRLVNYYEQQEPKGLTYDIYSPKTLLQSKGVVGFSLEIKSIRAIEKLSQNRKEDQESIIKQLENRCPEAQRVAELMNKNL
jgi:transcriptional regulator